MSSLDSGTSLTGLSLFTGAGGLDIGLESAGFTLVGYVEADETCRESVLLNREDWKQLKPYGVIEFGEFLREEGVPDDLSDLDIIAGGPPCQPFSKAAQWQPNGRAGLADPRAMALHGFIDLVELLTPRAVMLENVIGFAKGRTSCLSYIREALSKINELRGTSYELTVLTVNAADYGVPQRRERAILVAFRNGEDFKSPTPTHQHEPVTAWDALHAVDEKEAPSPTGKWADLLPTIPEGENYIWHTNRGGGSNLFGYRTRFWSFLLKLSKRQPSWTVPANPGPSTGPFHWDNRPLTPQETLRLQSFPASWQLAGSNREQLRQAGNATPPLLAEVMGRSIVNRLAPGSPLPDQPRLCIARAAEEPPPAATPKDLPKRFLELVGDHPDHPGEGKGPSPVS